MWAKKFEKDVQVVNPLKRQERITKYLNCASPKGVPYDPKKTRKSKRLNAKASASTPESPTLRKWLLKHNSPKVNIAKEAKSTDKNVGKTGAKSSLSPSKSPALRVWLLKYSSPKTEASSVGGDKPDVENLPNVAAYDRIESRKRLNKLRYYARRIARHEEHRKIVEEIEEIEKASYPSTFSPTEETPQRGRTLDCRDMTKADLMEALCENSQYLKGIVTGAVYSKRHETFKMERRDGLTKESLSYNVSMIAFTMKQKLCLSKRLAKMFEDNVDYHMKVLLPELCLKIFMDKYNMSYEEAYQYLDSAPLLKGN